MIKINGIKFTLSLFCFFNAGISFSQGIIFDSLNYNAALIRAKNENKYIFLDAYTSWCLPCKIMDKEVFATKEVSDVYQQYFISLKVDMEKGDGIELRKKFNVNSFPTLIYLNSSGQVVNKVSGALPKEQFIELGKKVSGGYSLFLETSEKYNSGERNIELLSKYTDLLKIANDFKYIQVADEWFALLKREEKLSDEGMIILSSYITGMGSSIHTASYRFFADNKPLYIKKYTADSVNFIHSQILRRALQYAISTKDTTAFLETLAESYRQDFVTAKLNAARWELSYYQRKDSSNYLRLARQFSNSFFKNNAEDLMGIAWTILEVFPQTENLQFASVLIDRAVKLDPKTVQNYEIKARILTALHKTSQAIKFLQSSILSLKNSGINVSRLEKLEKKLN